MSAGTIRVAGRPVEATGPFVVQAERDSRFGDWQAHGLGLSWTALPERLAGGRPGTRIDVTPMCVTATTSDLNETPLSLVTARDGQAVCTDLVVAHQLSDEVGGHIRTLDPGITVTLHRDGRLQEEPRDDWLIAALESPVLDDPELAGTQLLEMLAGAINDAIPPGAREVAVLLSGGIDSGSVATVATHHGLGVVCYSAGTPWGDEHDDAAELCRHLGVEHRRIDLSLKQILNAIPLAIRWLGHAEPDKVDIAVIGTAMAASDCLDHAIVLTGYGSDLINLGLPGPHALEDPESELPGLRQGLEDARRSGELSGQFYRASGRLLVHPYWHPRVIEHCLSVTPRVKLWRGREKGHLRQAMSRIVPDAVAWRAKVAVHHGGGLQAGLGEYFGGREAKARAYEAILRDLKLEAV